MIKKIWVLLFCFFSIAGFANSTPLITDFACPAAQPTNSTGFCASFKTAAICYCTSAGLPAGMCQNISTLYNRMLAIYGSLENACASQRYTTKQDCIDNWNCYRLGGIDSQRRSCSATKKACQ
ncbi:MAG: hypothetical protein PSV35_00985 [bacterium]|nr:hypothetical protein [bacterium]